MRLFNYTVVYAKNVVQENACMSIMRHTNVLETKEWMIYE